MNYLLVLLSVILIGHSACVYKEGQASLTGSDKLLNEEAFVTSLKKHLDAVESRDVAALKSTMSPEGKMELIQPGLDIIYSVDSFMEFHQEWFDLPDWTVDTKILSMNVGDVIGVATTEFMYKEPERNGKPYFNRLSVSYTLEKMDGVWYVIKDHACSAEKSTD